MEQKELFSDERGLFERLCTVEYLEKGFKAVKRNGGAPGIDEVTVEEFDSCLDAELEQLRCELESWNYKPKPVLRVEIPKPGKGAGVRLRHSLCQRQGGAGDIETAPGADF
jgi:RNA-directed DNA polymerase